MNVYSYCDGDPVGMADPDCLWPDWLTRYGLIGTTFGQLFVGENWSRGVLRTPKDLVRIHTFFDAALGGPGHSAATSCTLTAVCPTPRREGRCAEGRESRHPEPAPKMCPIPACGIAIGPSTVRPPGIYDIVDFVRWVNGTRMIGG